MNNCQYTMYYIIDFLKAVDNQRLSLRCMNVLTQHYYMLLFANSSFLTSRIYILVVSTLQLFFINWWSCECYYLYAYSDSARLLTCAQNTFTIRALIVMLSKLQVNSPVPAVLNYATFVPAILSIYFSWRIMNRYGIGQYLVAIVMQCFPLPC